MTTNNKALCERTDDEIRARARELHEQTWVIEIDDDAEVVRPELGPPFDTVLVRAWIVLGVDD